MVTIFVTAKTDGRGKCKGLFSREVATVREGQARGPLGRLWLPGQVAF